MYRNIDARNMTMSRVDFKTIQGRGGLGGRDEARGVTGRLLWKVGGVPAGSLYYSPYFCIY